MDIFLLALFLSFPWIYLIIIYKIQKKKETEICLSDYSTVLKYPNFFNYIGIFFSFTFSLIIILFHFLSKEKPHLIFYIIFYLFYILGAYICIKAITYKVLINDKNICFLTFASIHKFKFSDIVLVIRQVKQNKVNSERIIIKTKLGKKFIVENSCSSYKKFIKKILEVENIQLDGF